MFVGSQPISVIGHNFSWFYLNITFVFYHHSTGTYKKRNVLIVRLELKFKLLSIHLQPLFLDVIASLDLGYECKYDLGK